MMQKRLMVLAGALLAATLGIVLLKYTTGGAELLWRISAGGSWLLPLVTVAAILDSVNPCAFSVLLITIAFLLSLGRPRMDIVNIGGFYILGIFVVYVLIGLGIIQALHLFGTPHFMAKVAAWVLIGVGLINLIGEFFPKFPIKLKIPQAAHAKMARFMEKGSLAGAFALGALVGICEFPCTGGPYLLVLGLLHDQATYWKGLSYLLYYNLVFILPLAVILGMASDRAVLERVRTWKKEKTAALRFWSSVGALALGLFILIL